MKTLRLLSLFLLLAGALPATPAFPGLQSLMTDAEWKRAGLDRLTPDQIGVIDAVLIRYNLQSNRAAEAAAALDPTPGGARCLYTSFPQSKKQKGEPIDRTLGKDGFHRTFTIDYTFILGGEVTMFLDIGQTDVKAGDVVIQRNTAHAWHNYSATPTSLVALLVRV